MVSTTQILEFNVAFPDEIPMEPEEYLKGGSRQIILTAAVYFLATSRTKSKLYDNKYFLEMFFCKENKEFALSIWQIIKEIEKKGQEVRIINSFSSLSLFELFFSKDEEPETQTHSEFEVNLFKAYLVLNSRYIKKQEIALASSEKLEVDMRVPMMMLCTDYPVADKNRYDIGQIWVTQLVKAVYLFQFFESNDKTKVLLKEFLKFFNKATWKEYLKCFLSLTLAIVTTCDNEETYIDISIDSENFDADCYFLEKFTIEIKDDLNEFDFLTIRSKPFYKIETGKYRIIFDLFVVEKIHKSIYFLFRDINEKTQKELKIKDFKSFYGKEFSEKILTYKVVDCIFPGKCIKYSGQELENKKIEGMTDYYIRKGKNILLFESKDFLIRADKKLSFDYEIYKEEFRRILYYTKESNGKESPKAVMQLINSIEKILRSEFKADKDYKYKEVNIYPILLTHDQQFEAFGFNYLLNDWFKFELEQLKNDGLFIHKVRPLTVINIDSLIFHQMGLIEIITLHDLIDKYISEQLAVRTKKIFKTFNELQDFCMSKYNPFSIFITNYFINIKYKKYPPILDIIETNLFS